MGCYYKKKNKPNVALFYLMNALEIEKKDPNADATNIAGTHLNLCAIFSKLGKQQEAVVHAKRSIVLIEEQIKIKEADD